MVPGHDRWSGTCSIVDGVMPKGSRVNLASILVLPLSALKLMFAYRCYSVTPSIISLVINLAKSAAQSSYTNLG